MSTNTQGLTNKTKALEILAHHQNVDIICVSEHWFCDENATLYNLQNYTNTSCYTRQEYIHGGVCIFTRNSIQASEIKLLCNNSTEVDCEMAGVYLQQHSFIIIPVYRSPNGNFDNFLQTIESTLTQITALYKHNVRIIIAGDFNAHFHNYNPQNSCC